MGLGCVRIKQVYISDMKPKLSKSIDYLNSELSKVRTGRASPALLESVKVNAYDSVMEVRELGTIAVADAQNLVISPWDKGLLKEIAKGISSSDLNLNPVVDGDVVRISIPDLTEERRKELTKLVTSKVEEVKTSVRNIRQEAMKEIDKDFADKKIGEDEKFKFKEDVEEIIKDSIQKVVNLGEDKKKDLLNI